MVRTSLGVSGGARRDRRRIADIDDLARQLRQIVHDGFGQCLLVSRLPAVPFELVHEGCVIWLKCAWPEAARGIAFRAAT